jgi:hypothetical protein
MLVEEDEMSLYQLHAAMYLFLNPRDGAAVSLEPAAVRKRFDLTDRELRAFVEVDVPELYRLGVHPVLLNSYARARMSFAEYRDILSRLRDEERAEGL